MHSRLHIVFHSCVVFYKFKICKCCSSGPKGKKKEREKSKRRRELEGKGKGNGKRKGKGKGKGKGKAKGKGEEKWKATGKENGKGKGKSKGTETGKGTGKEQVLKGKRKANVINIIRTTKLRACRFSIKVLLEMSHCCIILSDCPFQKSRKNKKRSVTRYIFQNPIKQSVDRSFTLAFSSPHSLSVLRSLSHSPSLGSSPIMFKTCKCCSIVPIGNKCGKGKEEKKPKGS